MSGKIAFLGLGAMGFGMATNLIKKPFHVTGFDVYSPTLARFTGMTSPPQRILRSEVWVCGLGSNLFEQLAQDIDD